MPGIDGCRTVGFTRTVRAEQAHLIVGHFAGLKKRGVTGFYPGRFVPASGESQTGPAHQPALFVHMQAWKKSMQ